MIATLISCVDDNSFRAKVRICPTRIRMDGGVGHLVLVPERGGQDVEPERGQKTTKKVRLIREDMRTSQSGLEG